MRDIRNCSGPWKGTWAQGSVRGTMHQFRLRFAGNGVTGEGQDLDGPFTMQGEVDAHRVYLIKAYPWLLVRYDGTWNGSFLAGRSTIGPLAHGEFGAFEMWPEDEEETVEFAAEAAETREPQLA